MNYILFFFIIVFRILCVLLIDMIIFKLIRRNLSSKYYNFAKKRAEETNKKLLVIGDPCIGNYRILSFLNPDTGHGDLTLDLYGCDKCNRINVNNMNFWKSLETNKYVIYETATISFSEDLISLVNELNRITGGDFYTSGSTNSLFWKYYGHKLYSNYYTSTIKYTYLPYNSENDDSFKCYNIFTKKTTTLKLQ